MLKSHLENRKQFVKFDGISSEMLNVIAGAAQGSVLEPLLFIIYIDDSLRFKLNGIPRLYADDAASVYFGKTVQEIYDKIRSDLIKQACAAL